MPTQQHYDCVIIGGGPAGLTAAIYLARFHLATAVFDDNRSRAAMIPLTHNHAGFPEGIAGAELLRRMRIQTQDLGVLFIKARVHTLAQEGEVFRVESEARSITARAVLLATGVANHRPPMPDDLHNEALRRGLLRYCPVCDGYEVTDRNVGVLGTGDHALREAQFLRSYSAQVTLVAMDGPHMLSAAERCMTDDWGIVLRDGPMREMVADGDAMRLHFGDEARLSFDTVYPALGSDVHSHLAKGAGAHTSEDGCILVDKRQMTSVAGLYAAGDVVAGLDQISTAMGHAATAATAMRNALCAARPLRR